jgi:hypothetical protein
LGDCSADRHRKIPYCLNALLAFVFLGTLETPPEETKLDLGTLDVGLNGRRPVEQIGARWSHVHAIPRGDRGACPRPTCEKRRLDRRYRTINRAVGWPSGLRQWS